MCRLFPCIPILEGFFRLKSVKERNAFVWWGGGGGVKIA